MLGWSKSARIEHIKLDLFAVQSSVYQAAENTLNFEVTSHLVFQDNEEPQVNQAINAA